MDYDEYYQAECERLTKLIIDNICYHLAHRNWTLKMLADKADLPYESVKKLINGKIRKPSFISIYQLSVALDCSIDSLINRKDDEIDALLEIEENAYQISKILSNVEHLLDTQAMKNRKLRRRFEYKQNGSTH